MYLVYHAEYGIYYITPYDVSTASRRLVYLRYHAVWCIYGITPSGVSTVSRRLIYLRCDAVWYIYCITPSDVYTVSRRLNLMDRDRCLCLLGTVSHCQRGEGFYICCLSQQEYQRGIDYHMYENRHIDEAPITIFCIIV